ncbi:dihydroorotate dehydrogenase [bacterium]|nr:dihydroorotate dehydrogenase [bacterium]
MVDLSVKIGKLKLKNPVLTASGTFGYGTEYGDYFDAGLLGGLITKTITRECREGNPMPRIAETPCGRLNSIGLANIGVDRFCGEKLSELNNLDTVVIVNVAGSRVKEYSEVVKKIQEYDRVDGFEINISCPNVKKGGLAFGTDPQITEAVVSGVRKATKKTVIVKLTPNVTDIVAIARASVDGGADALSLINTVLGMGVNIETRQSHLASVVGGLSGPAIKPIALAKVYHVAKAVSVPVIGMGGIMNWQDAIAFFIVGATAVEVGTLNFIEPDGVVQIIQGIESYCEKKGIISISELTGSLQEG